MMRAILLSTTIGALIGVVAAFVVVPHIALGQSPPGPYPDGKCPDGSECSNGDPCGFAKCHAEWCDCIIDDFGICECVQLDTAGGGGHVDDHIDEVED